MRIVSWNCCGGLDTRKVTKVSQYDADILVVPECREEDMAASGYPAEQRDWYGDHAEAPGNPHKDLGVGLFWKAGLRVERLREGIAPCRYVLPYQVTLPAGGVFTLFAVWTKKDNCGDHPYVGQVWKAAHDPAYQQLLEKSAILIGDFNSNKIWDNCNPKDRNHSALVEWFAEHRIRNCACAPKANAESTPTYFYGDRQVTDDYCFATEDWFNAVTSFAVGPREPSDHCPLIVDFDRA